MYNLENEFYMFLRIIGKATQRFILSKLHVSSPLANAGMPVNIMAIQAEPINDITETLRTTSLSTKFPQHRDWLEAFWIACEEDHFAGVEKQAIRGVDVNATVGPSDCISQYGTGLTGAVHTNRVEVVRSLFEHGARPNQPTLQPPLDTN